MRGEREKCFTDISSQSLARLFSLAAHLGYDGKGPMLTERTPITLINVRDVMQLAESTFNSFWKEVSSAGYISCCKEQINLSNDFVRGKTDISGYDNGKMRIYKNGLCSLYKTMRATQHRYLGHILKLLPYVNQRFNVLTWDVFELSIDKLKPLSVEDIASILGIYKHDSRALGVKLSELKFSVDGKEFGFCSIKTDIRGRELVTLDPHILFAGGNWQDQCLLWS